jgi:DNA-binding FrmR family transcriptional regulator
MQLRAVEKRLEGVYRALLVGRIRQVVRQRQLPKAEKEEVIRLFQLLLRA